MGRGACGAACALVLILLLRSVPYLITGTVFSTDSWALLRNALVFGERSPINLYSHEFDGYNNYWPGPSISLAILKLVTATPLVPGYLYISLSSTLVYTLLLAKSRRTPLSFWSLLLPGLLFSVVMMTSAFTKEGYAYSLLAGALFLTVVRGSGLRGSRWLAVCILLSSLVICHHLTAVVLGLILGGYLLRWFFGKIFHHIESPVDARISILSLLLLLLFAGAHYTTLGRETFISNYISHWYAIATASWMTILSLIPFWEIVHRRRLYILLSSTAIFTALAVFHVSVQGIGLRLDGGIAVAIASALLLLLNTLQSAREQPMLAGGWLIGLVALIIVLMLEGTALYYWIIYRLLTFILIAFAISRVDSTWSRLLVCAYSTLSIILFALTLTGSSVSLGWHWLYWPSEISLAKLLSSHTSNPLRFVSDIKYSSLLKGLFNINSTGGIGVESGYTILDEYMFTKGCLAGAGVAAVLEDGPADWFKSSNGILYSSGGVFRKWLVLLS